MRTTLNIRDDVLKEIRDLFETRTRTEAVNRALDDYVRLKRLEKLKSLRGKLPIKADNDRFRELENHE